MAPICVCRHCTVRDIIGDRTLSETAIRRLHGLCGGRALILEDEKRAATRKSYTSSLKHLHHLLTAIELELPDVDGTILELLVVAMLTEKEVDTPTCDNTVKAVWDLFEFLKVDCALRGLRNPCESPRLHKFLKVVRQRFKKVGKARLPLTMQEARDMLAFGFDGERQGKHARMYYMFLTWGCLRKKACANLKIVYTINRAGEVEFGEGSDVTIFNDEEFGDIIKVRVVGDKNLRSGERHYAYMVANSS